MLSLSSTCSHLRNLFLPNIDAISDVILAHITPCFEDVQVVAEEMSQIEAGPSTAHAMLPDLARLRRKRRLIDHETIAANCISDIYLHQRIDSYLHRGNLLNRRDSQYGPCYKHVPNYSLLDGRIRLRQLQAKRSFLSISTKTVIPSRKLESVKKENC